MKKIFNCFKTLIRGVLPAISGSAITLGICYCVRNIQQITTGSGWTVVFNFILAAIEIILSIALLYELGTMNINAKQWNTHKCEEAADTIDGSSDDNETSDEAADA